MAKRGRPSKRTPAVEQRVIDGLRSGTPLTVICDDDDMPCDTTVRNWMDADPDFSSAIARAREAGFDRIAQEAKDIIDAVPERVVTITGEDRSESRIDSASVQWAFRRAELRLKLLAKWDPKRYGDKIDVTSGGDKIQREADEVTKFSRLAALISEKQQAGELPSLDGGE